MFEWVYDSQRMICKEGQHAYWCGIYGHSNEIYARIHLSHDVLLGWFLFHFLRHVIKYIGLSCSYDDDDEEEEEDGNGDDSDDDSDDNEDSDDDGDEDSTENENNDCDYGSKYMAW